MGLFEGGGGGCVLLLEELVAGDDFLQGLGFASGVVEEPDNPRAIDTTNPHTHKPSPSSVTSRSCHSRAMATLSFVRRVGGFVV